jgi:DNA invertase Pin-like site-specific DNA recombinase/ferredoxin
VPLAVATYQRVSKKEQANNSDAFVRQGWQLDRAAKEFAPDLPRMRFRDIQTGRRDDRPGFMALMAAIEAGKIGVLIVTRLDRLARDLETSAKIQKIMEKRKIRVFEVTGKSIEWGNSNDWSYYSQAGLDSERESRKLSERIIQTYDWQRSQQKLAGGMVGFPYRRNEAGKLEPDPESWQLAIDYIKIVIDCGGATMDAISRIRDMGGDRTRSWLSGWIRSPLIRGHIPIEVYEGKGRDRKKKRIQDVELFRDAHPSLFSDPQLVGCEKIIDRIIADSSRYKGRSIKRYNIALSGLIWCGRCNAVCHVKVGKIGKKGSQRIYAICSSRNSKGISCGGEYRVRDSSNPINTPYQLIEEQVLTALTNRATELIDLELARMPTERVEHPDITKLKDEIKRLESLNDPDLKSAIAKKTNRLNELLLADPTDTVSAQMRQTFIDTFSDGDLSYLDEIEKRSFYRDWIREIKVDRNKVEVRLAI